MIMSKMKETRNAFFCIENFPLRRLSAIKFRPDSRDCNRQLMIEPKRFLEWPGTAGSPLALPSSIIKKLTCHRGGTRLARRKVPVRQRQPFPGCAHDYTEKSSRPAARCRNSFKVRFYNHIPWPCQA